MQSAPAFCPPLSNSGPDKKIQRFVLSAWLKRRSRLPFSLPQVWLRPSVRGDPCGGAVWWLSA